MKREQRGSPEGKDAGFARLDVLLRDGDRTANAEAIAEEVPIALEYNGIAHAVMFATPLDLEDFARGFTLSESIALSPSEIYGIEVEEPEASGVKVAIEIASERFLLLKDRRRALTGRTGCGLCGTESLEHAVRDLQPLTTELSLNTRDVTAALVELRARQTLMLATGAVHAAGWMDARGHLTTVREDVGRHNALDKLLGALLAAGTDLSSGAALITSRASFEMVQKAVTLGVPVLAAVSAPTALAVRMARQANLTLLGFVRAEHYSCYSAPHRLRDAELPRQTTAAVVHPA
jgi:FdhD protein